MSADNQLRANSDHYGQCVTFVYDGLGHAAEPSDAAGMTRQYVDRGAPTVQVRTPPRGFPASDGMPQLTPVREESFEFRLSGSERQERSVPLAVPATGIVAMRRVQAYLTGGAEGGGACSPIGGIEVEAVVRDNQLVCTAGLSEFAAGDLVVVRVEVAVY